MKKRFFYCSSVILLLIALFIPLFLSFFLPGNISGIWYSSRLDCISCKAKSYIIARAGSIYFYNPVHSQIKFLGSYEKKKKGYIFKAVLDEDKTSIKEVKTIKRDYLFPSEYWMKFYSEDSDICVLKRISNTTEGKKVLLDFLRQEK